ncbi:ankyrin repeats (3 copies) domain-containing protein [Trichoderma breve]|uniref:Ankyrin repeats (3 copies) domain-containing protein n=1 Tax=Trichoderma breve TaxID=2034170 RepID=A0A9W9E6S5_9HYPO|nr:ankyrin repeats (3 copies) domain-containing protein [Trichoderma breve]KAJ4858637.1 ankyrin repeats (3 copies) domain-containing protein [Trichoderma breve]
MTETATDNPNDTTIYRAPEELSRSLYAAFDGILLQIDKNLQYRVINSLKWLTFSFERLTIDLFTEILAQHTIKSAPLDEADRLVSTNSVLKCLSGLAVVDEHHVWLAEPSIKEYLTSSRIRHGPASAFSFTETDAHLHIAHSNLIHHLECNPQGIPLNTYENEEQNVSKLKTYAARNWPLHLEMVPRSAWPLETAQAANLALAMRSPSLFSMIDSLTSCPFLSTDAWTNPLIYTAYLGATQLTEMLISEGLDMHEYVTQWDLDIALLNASSAGNLETVRLLVDKGASIDLENATRRNPLTQAALGGHIEIVRYFVENEVMAAALDGTDVRKWALNSAAAGSHFDIIELLVRGGTEIDEYTLEKVAGSSRDEASILECLQFLLDNSPDITKEGALCKAVFRGNWKAFELLLGKGADINALGSRWGNSLHIACAALDIDQSRIEYLHGLGANPNVQGGDHGTAMQAVCYSYSSRDEDACIKVAKLLIALGVDIAAQGSEHGNALNNACASKGNDGMCWHNMVELLLKNGADVNAQGGPYDNALQTACHYGNSDLVPLLLAWGADVHVEGGAFTTALHAACFTRPKEGKDGDVKMVQLLLDHGADVNATAKNKLFGTAFQAACAAGNIKLVRLLLDSGADVNLQGGGYGSALQSACHWGHTEVVRFLLDNGVDVNAPVRKIGGRIGTALLTACSFWRNDDEMVHLLLDHGAHIDVPGVSSGSVLHGVASSNKSKDNSLLLRVLELGADINQVDERGGTALHYAFRNMRFDDKDTKPSRIRFLIEHGADIHLAVGELGSPLYCICAAPTNLSDVYEKDRTVALLLGICPDIDVNAQGGEYGSALQAAAWSGQAESIKLLIEKGAHVNVRGGKYGSALNAAIIMGYWNIVKILLENGARPDSHWRDEIDEDWLADVQREYGRGAVEKYRKFWEVEKRKLSGTNPDNSVGAAKT